MTQVQVRQTPLSIVKTTPRIAGAWYSAGYYGHFRAKSRADLSIYFRQLAQPNPPTKFLDRQKSEATSHLFSRHDNRFKFESDPLVRGTETGFGKRKSQTKMRKEFDPYFIGWNPNNVDRQKPSDDPQVTSYANDYNHQSTSSRILSEIQLPPSNISMYSTTFNHGQPDRQQAKDIREETFQRYSTAQTRRSQLKRDEQNPSVASCLVWGNLATENKPSKTNETPGGLRVRVNPQIISANNLPQERYQCQSVPTFKAREQPENMKIRSLPRPATSYEPARTHNMDCLISKYM